VCYERPIAVPADELPLLLPELEETGIVAGGSAGSGGGGGGSGGVQNSGGVTGEQSAGGGDALTGAVNWRFFQREEGGRMRWFARETNTMPQVGGQCGLLC
jgi:hypothetical protein